MNVVLVVLDEGALLMVSSIFLVKWDFSHASSCSQRENIFIWLDLEPHVTSLLSVLNFDGFSFPFFFFLIKFLVR